MEPIECFVIENTGEMLYSFEDESREPVRAPHGDGVEPPEGWQSGKPIYRRKDTGEEVAYDEQGRLPAGAMLVYEGPDSPYNHSTAVGPDGRSVIVIVPPGHWWYVDSEASNCDRKGTDHDCWCRHGEPPNLTVDKEPEPGRSTCSAGAGSILSMKGTPDEWHGFLRDGKLVA